MILILSGHKSTGDGDWGGGEDLESLVLVLQCEL